MVLEVALTELLATFWAGNLDRTLVLVLLDLFISAIVSVLADAVSEHIGFALELVIVAALPAEIRGMSIASSLRFCFFDNLLAFCLLGLSVTPW